MSIKRLFLGAILGVICSSPVLAVETFFCRADTACTVDVTFYQDPAFENIQTTITFADADILWICDGGTESATVIQAADMVDEGSTFSVTMSAGDLTDVRHCKITWIDAETKAYMDKSVNIVTYGDAGAAIVGVPTVAPGANGGVATSDGTNLVQTIDTLAAGVIDSTSVGTLTGGDFGVGVFAAGAITNSALATNAIDNNVFADGTFSTAKFQINAIDDTVLAPNAIGESEIAAGAITSSEAPNLDAAVSSRMSVITGTTQTATHTNTTIRLAIGAIVNTDDHKYRSITITSGACANRVGRITSSTSADDFVTIAETFIDAGTTCNDANVDLDAVTYEISTSGVSQAIMTAAEVNAEVDTALDTAIPGGPTADSINERIAAIDDLTQAAGAGDLAAILDDTGTSGVASVTGNVSGNVVGSVGSVTGAVGSVTGNVGGNVVGSVASVTGAVGSVTGNVGGDVQGNVDGSVASVTGNVGGNVVGSVGSVTNDTDIGDRALELAGWIRCKVETATDAQNIGCDLTNPRTDTVVIAQNDDFIGRRIIVISSSAVPPALGENATITDSIWDGVNSALDLVLSTRIGSSPGLSAVLAVDDIVMIQP